VAGEAAVPFFSMSGSDFVEMFVGVGASRVRDLFDQGKKNAPCIIFIDEIDAVGRHRGAGLGGGHDEREQTLNQLLVEMDGFESNEGVILLAATNRPDVLDPALLRPGRFDRQIVVDMPDINGREAILKVHMKKIRIDGKVSPKQIAAGTPGMCGADLENLVNEAALLAARKNHDTVIMEDFEDAKEKVMLGPERRSMVLTEKQKNETAYHESGHTVVAYNCEFSDPVHKVTIIPRGQALGLTHTLPEEDQYTWVEQKFLDRICVLLGGRAAEEIFLERIGSGAANDIKHVTGLARAMVTRLGMSQKLGPIAYEESTEQVFLGRDYTRRQVHSEKTLQEIDMEVSRIVSEQLERARSLLNDHRD
jgi:cell division protease FtsH